MDDELIGYSRMSTLGAVARMVDCAGMSRVSVSLALGKNRNHVGNILVRRKVPSADNLARIAKVCGYDLVLMPHDGMGDAIVIAPPDND